MNRRTALALTGGAVARLAVGAGTPSLPEVVGVSAVAEGTVSVPMFWIGRKLGFYEQEGIDGQMRATASSNATQAAQMVVAGRALLVTLDPAAVLMPRSMGRDAGITFVYCTYQRPTMHLFVTRNSPIRQVAQLKGRKIGLPALGVPVEPLLGAFLSEAGLQLRDAQLLPIGVDVNAAQALMSGTVDAVITPTLNYAIWRAAGYDFREFPQPRRFDELIGASMAVRRSTLEDAAKRSLAVKYLRVLAKSTVYTRANPVAAAKLLYDLYPQAKPRNVPNEQAIERGVASINYALQDYGHNKGKWGYIPPQEFANNADLLGVKDKVGNLAEIYSNSLIDEINNFDESAILRLAKSQA